MVRVEIGTLGVGVGVSTSRSLTEFNMEVIKTPAMQPGSQTYQILIVFFYLIFDFIYVSSDSS